MADVEEFIAGTRGSRSFHEPWVHPPLTANSYAEYLRAADSPRLLALLVCGNDDGRIRGVCNLSEIIMGRLQSAYLGFFVDVHWARQGVMREGVSLAIQFVFQSLGLHRLEANIQPNNLASLRFVERLGFRREGYSPKYLRIDGVWRDHERWALLSEEWQEAR